MEEEELARKEEALRGWIGDAKYERLVRSFEAVFAEIIADIGSAYVGTNSAPWLARRMLLVHEWTPEDMRLAMERAEINLGEQKKRARQLIESGTPVDRVGIRRGIVEDPTQPESPLALRANELARAIITARLEHDMNIGNLDSWQTWIDACDQVGAESWENPLMPRLVIGALSAIAAHAIRKLAPKDADLGDVMADLAMSWERFPFGY